MSDLFSQSNNVELKPMARAVKSSSSTSYYYYFGIIAAIIVAAVFLIWYLRRKPELSTVYGPYVLGAKALGGGRPEKVFEQHQIERSLGNNFTLSFFLYMNEVNKERIPFAGPKGEYRGRPIVYIQGVGDIVVDPIHQSLRLNLYSFYLCG